MSKKNYIIPLIYGLSIVLSSIFISEAFKIYKSKSTIYVNGQGIRTFKSDVIVWEGEIIRRNQKLNLSLKELSGDRQKTEEFLIAHGIPKDNISFTPVDISNESDISEVLTTNPDSHFNFTVKQGFQVRSNEIEQVENIIKKINEFPSEVIFLLQKPKYFYSKLDDLKISLIDEATKNATLRAQKIVSKTDSKLYKLKKAQLGVFQIISENYNDDFSWNGAFNTDSKMKIASVTVKLEYYID